MKFEMEQIALCPRDPEAAIALLKDMGIDSWVDDHVVALGSVRSQAAQNEADLAFNYTGLGKARELEVLHYTKGENWMNAYSPRVSHLGMHCTEAELDEWRTFFWGRGLGIAQEVFTQSHTNPAIAGKRKYHYVIFDTYSVLGVDVKFIVREDVA